MSPEEIPSNSEFERLLADPYEQFDKRSEILASIEAYSKAVPATVGREGVANKQGEIPQTAVSAALKGFGIPNPTEVRGVHIGVRWVVIERWDSDDEHYEIRSPSDYERYLAALTPDEMEER